MLRKIYFKWWIKKQNLQQDFSNAMIHFIDSKDFEYVSPYWYKLSKSSIRKIARYGFENFKNTVGQHYFLLVKWRRFEDYFIKVAELVGSESIQISTLIKKHINFDFDASTSYNFYTSLLFSYIKRFNNYGTYSSLSEPEYGKPPLVTLDNRAVSMDLCNSIIDFDSVNKYIPADEIKTVLEIGGGYGRDAYVFLSLLKKNQKYIMVDILPTLYIAQTYLSKIFPNKNIFEYQPFKDFEEVRNSYANSDIIFLTPSQMRLLPDKSIDLVLAIDCLHEMNKWDVNDYFNEFDRLAHNLYYKCWQKTGREFYQWKEYPIKKNWEILLNAETIFPAKYFETMCKIN